MASGVCHLNEIPAFAGMTAGISYMSQPREPPSHIRLPRPAPACTGRGMTNLAELRDEYLFLEGFDRIELLIDQGKAMEAMPEALKNERTLVKGCTAEVWTYPTRNADGSLHFLADSKSAVVKGIIALVLMTVQDKHPAEILNVDIESALEPFEVRKHLSSKRTSGIPNMIALIRETAARYA